MSPAFSSARQAAAFAILLLVLLLLPVFIGRSLLPPREQIYSSMWWGNGAWPYLDQQIFDEKKDIDIAFIGPSHIWYGIDDRYVQAKLSEQLGRPAVVRSFCWGSSGYDPIYFVAKDLLAHRKVHLMVFYDDLPQSREPHGTATSLFRLAENAADVRSLSLGYRASYYFAAVLGMPRNLLELLRRNFPTDLATDNTFDFNRAKTENIVERLGSVGVRAGYAPDDESDLSPFEDYHPPVNNQPSEVGIYPDTNPQDFNFDSEAIPELQLHFIRKLVALAGKNQTGLAMLFIPIYADRRAPVVTEGQIWKTLLPGLTIVGIPPAEMYVGLSDDEIKKLYAGAFHLNVNGQEYFTSIVTPALLKAYAKNVAP